MNVSEETKTLVTIIRHITLVQKNLLLLAKKLEQRALIHDLSKFKIDEFEGFIEINQIARQHKYGSPEYQASMVDKADLVNLHFSRNPHHPEHYPDGVADMSLIDTIEMVCDWKAASEAYGNTTLEEGLEIQRARFGLSEEAMGLIKSIIKELEL